MKKRESLKTKISSEKTVYVLRLFITGNTPQSIRAVVNIKRICEAHLKGHYDLEVIDIYKDPSIAKREQIIAAPTLVKFSPLPSKKLLGDLSDEEKVLTALGVKTQANARKE